MADQDRDRAAQAAHLKRLYEKGRLSEADYRAELAELGLAPPAVFEQVGQHVEQQVNIAGNVYLGPPPRNRQEELDIYCRVVAQACGQLPLRGVDVGASDATAGQKPLGLANVYVDLDTRTWPNPRWPAQPQRLRQSRKRSSRKSGRLGLHLHQPSSSTWQNSCPALTPRQAPLVF